MGLAASQARFLGITARKNACELRSMEIAQERLSVSNQLSQASQNYMTSLNATKLIWNPDRTDDYVFELDYATLTRPSAYNDFNLQLLTNIKGQTILDSTFYNAFSSMPIKFKDISGNPIVDFAQASNGGQIATTCENFKLFITTLNDQGIVTDAQLEMMLRAIDFQNRYPINPLDPDDGVAYSYKNGFGKNLANMSEVYSTDLTGLCDYVDAITVFDIDENSNSRYLQDLYDTYGSNPIAPTPYDMAAEVMNYLNFDTFLETVEMGHSMTVVKNASTPQPAVDYIRYFIDGHSNSTYNPNGAIDWSNPDLFNFADVMGTNDLALVGYAFETHHGWGGTEGNNCTEYINSIDKFVDNLENLAKYFFEFGGSEDEAALIRTREVIESLYKNSDGTLRITDANFDYDNSNNPGNNPIYDTQDTYMGGLPDYLNYCIPVKQYEENSYYIDGQGWHDSYAVVLSLSNLAQAFFTEYENQRSISSTGYNINTSTGFVGNCNLITMDQFYTYDYIDAGTTNPTGEISQILNYYSQMFNQMAVKGYTFNPAVDDPDKLQNMLKNGSLVVSSIKDDNYFYQYDYMAYGLGDAYFIEVADEDAITTAEAEYKVKQAQLNAKEEELSVDMQNVEAELAALTTEYDTVKNLINKSVQKDFTTCGG